MTYVKVNIKLPHGEVDGNVGVPHEMIDTVSLVPGALELSDQVVALALKYAEEAGHEITCKKGCSICCRQLVPVSKPEAFFLLDLMRQRLPDDRRNMVLARMKAAADKISEAGIADRLKKVDLTIDDHQQVGNDYFKLGMPCPFLTDTGACGIHPARPTACREYNVVTPAELCDDPVGNHVNVALPALKMSLILAQVYAQETGTKAEVMPLVLAPAWAAENEDQRGPKVEAPELFGRFMGILGRAGAPPPSGHEAEK